MESKKFEEYLFQMSKPDVKQLKHQEMLADAISKAKEKSVLSAWWLSIPLYLLATLLMKSYFMPSSRFFSNVHELSQKMKYTSLLFFVAVPLVFIIINFISIKKIYFYSGNSSFFFLIKAVWFNAFIILASLIILIIYF